MPINVEEVFVEDEEMLGRFQVEILASGADGWSPAVMAIEALVTNYRLFLKPFKKKYEHASIPNYYITTIEERELDGHSCISVEIKTGHSINMVLPRRHKKALFHYLLRMRVPKPKFKMDESVAQVDIKRLVEFFEDWNTA